MLCVAPFCANLGIKLLLVDDEPLMPPFGDQVHAIVGFHSKNKLLSLDLDQLDNCCDLKAGRCCGFVAYVDVCSDRLFPWPVKTRS